MMAAVIIFNEYKIIRSDPVLFW